MRRGALKPDRRRRTSAAWPIATGSQIMTQNLSNHTRPVDRDRIERIEKLLQRYPALTDGEMHEILMFLKKGPALEIGLLTGNDGIRPALARFRTDHARSLEPSGREIAIILAIIAIVVAAATFLWNWGTG